jgi:hypothetical protein
MLPSYDWHAKIDLGETPTCPSWTRRRSPAVRKGFSRDEYPLERRYFESTINKSKALDLKEKTLFSASKARACAISNVDGTVFGWFAWNVFHSSRFKPLIWASEYPAYSQSYLQCLDRRWFYMISITSSNSSVKFIKQIMLLNFKTKGAKAPQQWLKTLALERF